MINPNENIKDLIPYVPGKPTEELERELGISGSVKLASNENPLGPSPLALEAVKKSMGSINRYPDGDSYYLKTRLAEKHGVKNENIILGNGSNEVIEIAARAYLSRDDEAIYARHAFIVYPIVTQAIGAGAVVSPMKNLTHDLKDIYSRITDRTKIIFIANPNNPTGTIVKRSEVEWFLKTVPDNIIVLMDEAYFEYVDDADYPDSLDYHELREGLITVRTFSKIYGLAGLRVGYGIANSKMISYLNRVREPFNINSLAQNAALSALDDNEHVERSKRLNKEGMEYILGEISQIDVDVTESHTNFILIDLKRDPSSIYNRMLEDGVITRPVGGYGLKTHLRVSVGLPDENERFVRSIKKLID